MGMLSAGEDHTIAIKTGGIDITNAPSSSPLATSMPTISGTFSPTLSGLDFYFWGSPQAVGQPLDTPDVSAPLDVGGGVVSSTAGSKYTVILLTDGSALSAGFIQSIDDYQGHLGLDRNLVVEGVNEFQPISSIFDKFNSDPNDPLTAIIPAPKFGKVYGGVEDIPNTGKIHTILIDEDGNAYATGNNEKGELCLGDNVDKMIPEKIPIDGKVIDVAIGGEHTLLLLEDGTLYGCGSNADGQLGLDVVQDVSTPTLIEGFDGVLSISAGHSHSLFTAEDGIYYAGSNEFGQLCIDTSGDNIKIFTKLDVSEAVTSFEAIKESSYILYEDGSVRSCGRNNFGQLADGTNTDQILAEVQLADNVARLLGVGPSSESVFFVTTEEMVWGTGLNDRGQLGVGDIENRNVPTMVNFESLVLIDQLTVSDVHTVALGADMGILPTLPPVPTASPTISGPVTPSPTRQGMKLLFMGAPDSIGEDTPDDVLIPLDSGSDIISASGGSKYTVTITMDGTASTGGYIDELDTYQGHLGRDDIVQGINEMQPITFENAPQFDKAFAGVENAPKTGIIHTILLDANGRAWAMGSNSKGELCLGDNIDKMAPQRIPIDGKVIDVALGGEHTLLLLDDGTVYGCGSNTAGQIGLDVVQDVSIPTLIEGLNDVTSISAGHSHSLFMADSGIYFTGSNEFGQLCADTSGESLYTPGSLDIPGIEAAVEFVAIKESSFIRYSDGSVR